MEGCTKARRVSIEELGNFVEGWCEHYPGYKEKKVRIYARNEDGTYTAVDNMTGDCWVEDFECEDDAVAWLEDRTASAEDIRAKGRKIK